MSRIQMNLDKDYLSIEEMAEKEGYDTRDIEYEWIFFNIETQEIKCFHCHEETNINEWVRFVQLHSKCKTDDKTTQPPELF